MTLDPPLALTDLDGIWIFQVWLLNFTWGKNLVPPNTSGKPCVCKISWSGVLPVIRPEFWNCYISKLWINDSLYNQNHLLPDWDSRFYYLGLFYAFCYFKSSKWLKWLGKWMVNTFITLLWNIENFRDF